MGLQHMGIASNAYVLRSSVSCRRLVISILFPSSLLMVPPAVQVVFVATANQLQNMSAPLLDRLEIIQLSGYTLDEKRHIAQVPQAPPYMHQFSIHTSKVPYSLQAVKAANQSKSTCPILSSLMTYTYRRTSLVLYPSKRSLKVVAHLQRHLIPGLLGEHGLSSEQLNFPAEAISLIADGYTREVGFAPACLSCF